MVKRGRLKTGQLISVVVIFESCKASSVNKDGTLFMVAKVSDIFSQLKLEVSMNYDLRLEVPSKGMICIYHNLKIARNAGITRLEGNKMSYFINESDNRAEYFTRLRNANKLNGM